MRVPLQVLAGPVIPHRGARVGVTGGDLHVAQVSASVEHGRDIGLGAACADMPGDLDAGGFGEVAQVASGSTATSAKSHGFGDWRAAVSRAPDRRWVNPRVGDSAGTDGRRTCSAGECGNTPSRTRVQ
jgi:hypothetical protein